MSQKNATMPGELIGLLNEIPDVMCKNDPTLGSRPEQLVVIVCV